MLTDMAADMFPLANGELHLSQQQLIAARGIFYDYISSRRELSIAALDRLKSGPSIFMKYLLASDAAARGVGDLSELEGARKEIEEKLADNQQFPNVLPAMGFPTLDPHRFTDPRFFPRIRVILRSGQREMFDRGFENCHRDIPANNPPQS